MSEPITYAEWGADFFRTAVTAARIEAAALSLAGRPIEFGPLGVGPGKLAAVTAKGQVGAPVCTEIPGDLVRFELMVPVTVAFELDLQVQRQKFTAEMEIPLQLTAEALPDLMLVIAVQPPTAKEIRAKVKAEGLRATLVSVAADVEGELRRFVAKYVAREVDKPEILAARTIDVAGRIDSAWKA